MPIKNNLIVTLVHEDRDEKTATRMRRRRVEVKGTENQSPLGRGLDLLEGPVMPL